MAGQVAGVGQAPALCHSRASVNGIRAVRGDRVVREAGCKFSLSWVMPTVPSPDPGGCQRRVILGREGGIIYRLYSRFSRPFFMYFIDPHPPCKVIIPLLQMRKLRSWDVK